MYMAEIRGKFKPHEERKEDILTSNVFSFFKYANRDIFLYKLLKSLGINITKHDAIQTEFQFWPIYEDNTEPDMVLIIGDFYLLFEAKLYSRFGKETALIRHQLSREIQGGKREAKNLKKQFKLIAITAHYSRHRFLADVSGIPLDDILWINWHQIALLIYVILDSNYPLPAEMRTFAEDLYALLLKKNLRMFAGLEILGSNLGLLSFPETVFFNSITASYRGDFLGFVNTLCPQEPIGTLPDYVFIQKIKLFSELMSTSKLLPIREKKIFFGGNNEQK